jgi:hypothetical protein
MLRNDSSSLNAGLEKLRCLTYENMQALQASCTTTVAYPRAKFAGVRAHSE